MYYVSEETAHRIVTIRDAIATIDQMFRDYARGEAMTFPVVTGQGPDPQTRFSIKSGMFDARRLAGVKIGSYWPQNPQAGIPAHGSTTFFLEPDTGVPRAVVAASYLTALRTAASDAVAIQALARKDAATLAIIGTGKQAWYEVAAACEVRPIRKVFVAGRSADKAKSFAAQLAKDLGLETVAAPISDAVQQADIIITATAAREGLIQPKWAQPGTHISAMGADGPGKFELAPELVAQASLFADVIEQSVRIGEYEVAFGQGLIGRENITAIGDVLNGTRDGRSSDLQITVYDSSGMALQDLAIGEFALQAAITAGLAVQL
ncbi:ornithine cyclodeaminase family protein [Thalassospira marina]|uniref:Ornithine cyclodeaminase n=1 Tax=Thalassospira marina TaxID=2048283 RepID=A0A2N3KWJ5_9PROT|nr:ornithine cyclodeaminase family protein [Thalassospira marina]PKR54951.1 ornithine cyclodeaminase [Thalassospira marina]